LSFERSRFEWISMEKAPAPHLERGLNTLHATSLNIANMLGAGPFISIPVLLASMNGPYAMFGWLVAMLIVMCDGLVWSELGAALPGSGGTYHYFREIFKGSEWGRLLPFLFIWQFLVGGTLELASGYIGAANFVKSLWPAYAATTDQWGYSEQTSTGLLAALMVVAIGLSLCQRIRSLGWLSVVLIAGVLAAVGTVIVLGAGHFDPSHIMSGASMPQLDKSFLMGLGMASSIAVYDYLGYYNICHLGEEVKDPAKTIPRAVIVSIVVVAVIYLAMNLALISVVPWQEAVNPESPAHQNIAKEFMTRLYGERAAAGLALLIIWTCLAGVFAMTLGYSRIVYAAAASGDFFRPFAAIHPTRHYPWAALVLISGVTAVFCFWPLEQVINGAVTMRIGIQFIGQIFALHVLHRQGRPLPFRMWFYPLPSVLALAGWVFLLVTSEWSLLQLVAAVYLSGVVAYFIKRTVTPPAANGR
jgi:amino acid transporter